MRSRFEELLRQLDIELIKMGGLVEMAITKANTALTEQDVDLAHEIISSDDEIDNQEKEIEGLCLKLILRQQPVAQDLRAVSSILKIVTDLERIGDHASDISEITLDLAGKQYIKKLEHISQMASATMKMVTESIDAFVKKDLALARKVIAEDDNVDNLFNAVKEELIDLIKDNSENGDQAIDLIIVAKYFERIGDHAVNVAEWVIFSLTGKHKDNRII